MKTALLFVLLTSGVAFAGVHDSCHSDNHDSLVFAVAYTGAVIDLKSDEMVEGRKLYQMPALNYEQAFDAVCKVIDEHPELWERPSREAVTFAINALWKKKGVAIPASAHSGFSTVP
jgi:hypothetical protein